MERMKLRKYLVHDGVGVNRFEGAVEWAVDFTMKNQLLDRDMWKLFVEVFTTDIDDDGGWRCEFFGKMMRGACQIYRYRPDEELYSIIDESVRAILRTQRPDGRFSTYSEEKQFTKWDLWGRKYIITSLMHFVRICKDAELRREVVAALVKHVDHIAAHIGDGEGKISIVETSDFWLGLNSASILEALIDLYFATGKKSHLELIEHIVRTGGCSGANLIDLALENKVAPFNYPVNKAYEMMSFFEGVLAYYTLTEDEKYLTAVKNFVEAINDTDITIIGCAGCTHELFDNSAVRQTEESELIMQETCVTVTWMRLLTVLLEITGDARYADRVERAYYNAMLGAFNTKNQSGVNIYKEHTEPVPFDSYSTLYNGKRGRGLGGYMTLPRGNFYGCCAAIAAAGVACVPLYAAMTSRKAGAVVINYMLPGEIGVPTTAEPPHKMVLKASTKYPYGDCYRLEVDTEHDAPFAIKVRIPSPLLSTATATVNGERVELNGEWFNEKRVWKKGDVVEIKLGTTVTLSELNGKVAYTYGHVVLALDAIKSGRPADLAIAPTPVVNYEILKSEDDEFMRLRIKTADDELVLVDYASAGKYWTKEEDRVSVWLNVK